MVFSKVPVGRGAEAGGAEGDGWEVRWRLKRSRLKVV